MTREDIHIWRVDLSRSVAPVDERTLSDEERSRAGRFMFARDRNQFTLCKIALRSILGTMLETDPAGLEFIQGAHGKPRLTIGNLAFNLSHSGEYGLIAIAQDRELGIDIERIHPLEDALEIAKRFFSAEEQQQLSALVDPAALTRAFFECWTRKEAFIKAVGEGLSYPLDKFRVTFFPDEATELYIGSQASDRWVLVNIDTVPGYSSALVYERHADAAHPQLVHQEWA